MTIPSCLHPDCIRKLVTTCYSLDLLVFKHLVLNFRTSCPNPWLTRTHRHVFPSYRKILVIHRIFLLIYILNVL